MWGLLHVSVEVLAEHAPDGGELLQNLRGHLLLQGGGIGVGLTALKVGMGKYYKISPTLAIYLYIFSVSICLSVSLYYCTSIFLSLCISICISGTYISIFEVPDDLPSSSPA